MFFPLRREPRRIYVTIVICVFVCLLARLSKNYQCEVHRTCWRIRNWAKEQSRIPFIKCSKSNRRLATGVVHFQPPLIHQMNCKLNYQSAPLQYWVPHSRMELVLTQFQMDYTKFDLFGIKLECI